MEDLKHLDYCTRYMYQVPNKMIDQMRIKFNLLIKVSILIKISINTKIIYKIKYKII